MGATGSGRMLHAVVTAPYRIVIEETPIPAPGPGEVLIEIAACGICGTDLKINEGHYLGHLPVTPGHELAGRIAALGAGVTGLAEGDLVAMNPNLPCRRCVFCRRGRPHLCEASQAVGVTRAGGFAEYCAVPAELALPLPPGLAPEEAAMMEPVSCCLHGMDLAGVQPGESVILLGGGSIGLILLQLAQAAGAAWTAVSEPRPEKRELARRLGATHAVGPEEVAALAGTLPGGGAQVVVECAGVAPTAQAAMGLVRPGGTVLLFGVCPPDLNVPIAPYEVFHKEITIRGSYTNPFTDARALELLAAGRVQVAPLLSHVFPIERAEEGLAAVRAGETTKAQVRPGGR